MYPGVRVRRASAQRARWPARLPAPIRRACGVADTDPISELRIELGPGGFPTPGYFHVDINRTNPHLEYVAPAWDLPFRDGSVSEILAIHVLEHVHPGRLDATLREWHRVLRAGGFAQIHVPDGRALAQAYLGAPPSNRWAIGAAMLGMDSGPEVVGPDDLTVEENQPDHKLMLDYDLLNDRLGAAGFGKIENLTGRITDRHTEAWANVVPAISLIVRAQK
jgi:SAM-dependent methyltransferase